MSEEGGKSGVEGGGKRDGYTDPQVCSYLSKHNPDYAGYTTTHHPFVFFLSFFLFSYFSVARFFFFYDLDADLAERPCCGLMFYTVNNLLIFVPCRLDL